MAKLRAERPKTLAPVRASAAAEAYYHKRLMSLIAEMQTSLTHWLEQAYKRVEPDLAMDRDPAVEMREIMNKLARRWRKRFDDLAEDLAKRFVARSAAHTDLSLSAKLKRAGFTVKFRPTEPVKTILRASVAENVTLIKSIGEQHLTQVQSAVMRSVMTGRDLGTLATELKQRYGVTSRRAAFIARDQNNKASAAILRTRQTELGITEAIWKHSSAGKHPRPEHVKANGKKYDVKRGMLLEGVWTWPGVEPNCRCYSVPVIPGFDG